MQPGARSGVLTVNMKTNKRKLQRTRNLTRYTYAKTSFQGWRVCLSCNYRHFVRYVSDKTFGGEENSFAVALQLRDRVRDELSRDPSRVQEIFDKYKAISLPLDGAGEV